MSSNVFKFNTNIIVQKMEDDQYILFDGKKSIIYTCNETASIIVDLLLKQKNVEEIVAHMGEKYEMSIKKISADVSENIKYLLKNKVLIQTDSP